MSFIAEFTDNSGFNAKLTSEKLYIFSAESQETFALRGVSGIGVYDDIKDYNTRIEEYNSQNDKYERALNGNRKIGIFSMLIGGLFFFLMLIGGEMNTFLAFFALLFFIIGVSMYNKVPNIQIPTYPSMNSYFRIILAGGERSFQFNKNEKSATQIGLFINALEDTLTSYKK